MLTLNRKFPTRMTIDERNQAKTKISDPIYPPILFTLALSTLDKRRQKNTAKEKKTKKDQVVGTNWFRQSALNASLLKSGASSKLMWNYIYIMKDHGIHGSWNYCPSRRPPNTDSPRGKKRTDRVKRIILIIVILCSNLHYLRVI